MEAFAGYEGYIYAAIGIVLFILAFALFKRPIKLILKLCLNTLLGFSLLAVLDMLGVSIGVNWINAVTVGILGLPGLGALLIIRWLMLL